MKKIHRFRVPVVLLFLTAALGVNFSLQAEEKKQIDKIIKGQPEGVITGAGAHFSWIIFDAIKADLEKKSGRELLLYGKNSMLGQGCNAGIKNAGLTGSGHETFGFVCCPISDEERAKKKIQVHPLALEPLLILLNKSNPINDLSKEQVRAIFSGKITNWKEAGGTDMPIVVVTRLHCKKRPGHWKTILASKDDFRKDRLNVSSADEMVKLVTDFPGAIGHTGATWIFETGNKVKRITISKVSPLAANLKNKTYPFYRQLSAITDLNPTPDVMTIINEVQTGPAFFQVAERFELMPLNKPR